MNFLAHAYLSFNEPEIVVGNMISDFVKGKKRLDFDTSIQNGIMLHRSIDNFTDNHLATKEAKVFFRDAAGLYAGAFVDVVYDHFLAIDKNEFPDDMLLEFSLSVYSTLNNYYNILPEKFAAMFPYMRRDNWLYNYRKLNGTEKSFAGVARRAKYLETSTLIFESFQKNYAALKECYHTFFPDVKTFAYNTLLSFK